MFSLCWLQQRWHVADRSSAVSWRGRWKQKSGFQKLSCRNWCAWAIWSCVRRWTYKKRRDRIGWSWEYSRFRCFHFGFYGCWYIWNPGGYDQELLSQVRRYRSVQRDLQTDDYRQFWVLYRSAGWLSAQGILHGTVHWWYGIFGFCSRWRKKPYGWRTGQW